MLNLTSIILSSEWERALKEAWHLQDIEECRSDHSRYAIKGCLAYRREAPPLPCFYPLSSHTASSMTHPDGSNPHWTLQINDQGGIDGLVGVPVPSIRHFLTRSSSHALPPSPPSNPLSLVVVCQVPTLGLPLPWRLRCLVEFNPLML